MKRLLIILLILVAAVGVVGLTQSQGKEQSSYTADVVSALSDIGANQFYALEKFSRGAAGLAGAEVDPQVHVWIEDWDMKAQTPDASTMQLKAAQGAVSIDLTVKQTKPPTLEGDQGLSQKSP